jgi:hypothetical protein
MQATRAEATDRTAQGMKKITFFARLKKPWESFSVEIYTDKLAESGQRIVRES